VVAPGVDLKKQDQPVKPPTTGPADMPAEVAARQADLDWGLFGGPKTASGQLDLFDDTEDDDVDLALFAP
jgi:hypothetical protein